ncbi:F0F1 ATP synthase subunit A [Ammoniphilus oxalaticus]|uniref:ATP synthase subunit a n=1 Tax=Ammoniphilus oxalaticus TaxID=66863 RepID=A0A419SH18_9BACL|nr:F0F1 ATP synthase subunit A [Ammoniphilus oxalaticus]RKD23063.1 F0F1 ATP synthase subunit A [Ammoniphilus oxalaticus]
MDTSAAMGRLFGLDFNLAIVLTTTASAIIVFLIARAGAAAAISSVNSAAHAPRGAQNFMEWVIEFVRNVIGSTMDMKKGERYLGLGVTIILYIFVSNMIGLPLTFVAGNEVWWTTPTADPHVTLSLSVAMIILTQIFGLRDLGVGGYLKSYLQPQAWMVPLNIIEQFASALTLGMRLFGNMFAGGLLLGLLASAVYSGPFAMIGAAVPMIVWEMFSIFVGAIQSFVFLILTMVYISHRIAVDH